LKSRKPLARIHIRQRYTDAKLVCSRTSACPDSRAAGSKGETSLAVGPLSSPDREAVRYLLDMVFATQGCKCHDRPRVTAHDLIRRQLTHRGHGEFQSTKFPQQSVTTLLCYLAHQLFGGSLDPFPLEGPGECLGLPADREDVDVLLPIVSTNLACIAADHG
jgi:hypothetical protein